MYIYVCISNPKPATLTRNAATVGRGLLVLRGLAGLARPPAVRPLGRNPLGPLGLGWCGPTLSRCVHISIDE